MSMRKPEKKDYLIILSTLLFIILIIPVVIVKSMFFDYFTFFDKWAEMPIRFVKRTIVSKIPNVRTSDKGDMNVEEFRVVDIRLRINSDKVFISGDFTKWKPQSMEKINDEWIYSVPLIRGNYKYIFIVDGKEILDPLNPSFDYYENRKVSVITVK